MWERHGSLLKGLAGGLVGVLLALLLVHLWTDHVALHALVDLVNANAAQARVAPPVAPPSAPESE